MLKIFFKIYKKAADARNRIKLAYYKYLWKTQFTCDADFALDNSVNIDIQSGEAGILLNKGVAVRKYCSFICSAQGKLEVGENVFFNNYCSVNCMDKITIGANTIFGEGVRLYDHNHLFTDHDKLTAQQGMKFGSIEIGANCWIGSNTVILPNVKIGDNVVIGANNLIYKSIPANSVVKLKTEQIIQSK